MVLGRGDQGGGGKAEGRVRALRHGIGGRLCLDTGRMCMVWSRAGAEGAIVSTLLVAMVS